MLGAFPLLLRCHDQMRIAGFHVFCVGGTDRLEQVNNASQFRSHKASQGDLPGGWYLPEGPPPRLKEKRSTGVATTAVGKSPFGYRRLEPDGTDRHDTTQVVSLNLGEVKMQGPVCGTVRASPTDHVATTFLGVRATVATQSLDNGVTQECSSVTGDMFFQRDTVVVNESLRGCQTQQAKEQATKDGVMRHRCLAFLPFGLFHLESRRLLLATYWKLFWELQGLCFPGCNDPSWRHCDRTIRKLISQPFCGIPKRTGMRETNARRGLCRGQDNLPKDIFAPVLDDDVCQSFVHIPKDGSHSSPYQSLQDHRRIVVVESHQEEFASRKQS